MDATTFLRRIQASRDADLQGFGMDTHRDLLKLAAGSPRDPTFARSLAGRDALTLNTKTSRVDVMEKCKKALKLYEARDYKADFGFIDYVSPVRQRDLVEQLDALAFAELRGLVNGGSSDLHIALPDILDPEEGIDIGYYGIGLKSGAKPAHNELAIEDYVAELQAGDFSQIVGMAELRASHEARVIVDGEGDKKRRRKIYECFVFEVEHQGVVYVLFGGEWFAVEKAFHASVEAGFDRLVAGTPFVASTTAANERGFIAELDGHRRRDRRELITTPMKIGEAAKERQDVFRRGNRDAAKELVMKGRRSTHRQKHLICAATSLICVPAIVRPTSLMRCAACVARPAARHWRTADVEQ